MMSAMVSWNGMGEVCGRWYESVDPIDDDFVQQIVLVAAQSLFRSLAPIIVHATKYLFATVKQF